MQRVLVVNSYRSPLSEILYPPLWDIIFLEHKCS